MQASLEFFFISKMERLRENYEENFFQCVHAIILRYFRSTQVKNTTLQAEKEHYTEQLHDGMLNEWIVGEAHIGLELI